MIKFWVIDVDGTMTDGGIYYDESGNEMKKFNTYDAAGFFAAHKVGAKIIVLTGRECIATQRRMSELKVDFLFQGVRDKYTFLKQFIRENGIQKEELGYIGDDLNDLWPMQLAGFVACPSNACVEIKEISNYISPLRGGDGAVRDVIEYTMRMENQWELITKAIYNIGI